MKRWVVIGLTLGNLVAAFAAPPDVDAQREIRALEQQLNDALTAVDVRTIDRIWSDDFLFVNPAGHIATKAQRMSGLKPAAVPAALVSSLDDMQVRVYGATAVAIVKTTWRGTVNAQPIADPYVATHVWVRSAGRWRLVSAHVSQVEAKH